MVFGFHIRFLLTLLAVSACHFANWKIMAKFVEILSWPIPWVPGCIYLRSSFQGKR